MAALDRAGLADNTLVIFTSDNGGVLDDGYQDGSDSDTSGHRPNGALRGYKGSLFEGGHRVPFIARWPGRVPVGLADQLLCHVDLLATCAVLLGQRLADGEGPDSCNALPALLGEPGPVRDHLIHHTGGYPGTLALRHGPWKLLEAGGAGYAKKSDREPLLFNLEDDPAEEHDLASDHQEKMQELKLLLAERRR